MHHQPNLKYYELDQKRKTHIAFSGGRSSGFQLYHLIQANPWFVEETWKEDGNLVVIFSNTGKELDETYDFVKRCGDEWGIKIIWLEFDVENPENLPLDTLEPKDVIKYTRGHEIGKPTWRVVDHKTANRTGAPFIKSILKHRVLPTKGRNPGRYCTIDMKITVVRRFLNQGPRKWDKWHSLLGLRWDEEERLTRAASNPLNTRWTTDAPMVHDEVTKEDIQEFWKEHPFDLGLGITNGKTIESNCDHCYLRSQASKVFMMQKYPERFKWWEDLEKVFTEEYGKPHQFNNKESYSELRGYVDAHPESLKQDGAFCQASDGECFGVLEEGEEMEGIFEDE